MSGVTGPQTPRRFTLHVKLKSGVDIADVARLVRGTAPQLEWSPPRQLVAASLAKRLLQAIPRSVRGSAPALDRHWALDVPGRLSRRDAVSALAVLHGAENDVAWAGAFARANDPSPSSVSPKDEPQFDRARHLMGQTALGHGVDAWYAWRYAAGDGSRASVVDVERGWHTDHEDIRGYHITLPGDSVNDDSGHGSHGLAVLAVVGAQDNHVGMLGTAPGLRDLYVASTVRDGMPLDEDDHVAALGEAWDLVRDDRGIILIESQVFALNPDGTENDDVLLPAEYLESVREVIWDAVESGVTVVAAAGNAPSTGPGVGEDLANWFPGRGQSGADAAAGVARPAADGVIDSGSILVGAVDPASPHAWDFRTNHGLPIDCWAWANNVRTATWIGGLSQYGDFGTYGGGTSAAAAIVAGVAATYRSLFEEYRGRPPEPEEIRAALHARVDPPDPTAASPAVPPDPVQLMPNLRRLIDKELQLPYAWVRSALGDTGEPSSHNTSVSPDIVPWPSPISASDAEATLGPGTATENALLLGGEPPAGGRGHVVVRVRNRSAQLHVRRVHVNVHESRLCTSPMPWAWNRPRRTVIGPVPPNSSWAIGRVRLRAAEFPRTFTTVMGIGGKRPARREELSRTGRLRWLQRQMRAIAVRSFARWENAVRTDTDAGATIVALPFVVAGEPDRECSAQLRATYSASASIRPCMLVGDSSPMLSSLPATDVVTHALLPRNVIWLDDWDGSVFTSNPLSLAAQAEIPVAIGFESAAMAGRRFASAQIVQTDENGDEMGRILWEA